MAKEQYCIVDVTIDSNIPLEGLDGLSLEAAQNWIEANQVALEEGVVEGHAFKFLIQRDNWVEVDE